MNVEKTWARLAWVLDHHERHAASYAPSPYARVQALLQALPPVVRYLAAGYVEEMTEADIIRWARMFQTGAEWVLSAQQSSTEVTQ